ncbi:hypothetical protein B0H14DRAFT_3451963 [Mycena olivaceomarginata]|nr:hypothetical protein B0H14DRAFT_3451963 [Mycena olivaceomarginata]
MSGNKSVDLAPLTDDELASSTSRNSTVPSQRLRKPLTTSSTQCSRRVARLLASKTTLSGMLSLPVTDTPWPNSQLWFVTPKFDFDRQTALAILAAGLPSFHLAVSTLDPPVPMNNTDAASEWQFFPFPVSESYALQGFHHRATTTAAEGPTRDQLNHSPHLSKAAPRPRTPSEVANSLPLAVSPPPKPATRQKEELLSFRQAKSASVVPSEDSGEDEPLSKRRKTAGKGNRDVSELPGPHDTSALRRSKRSEATAPKSPSGKSPGTPLTAAVQAKINAMIPIIRTKLAEMLVERTKSGFCFIRHEETHYTITLSAFQGNRAYIPNNTFGPAPLPKKKGELPKELLVNLVRFSAIDYEQVLQPPGTCLLCLMYGITCNPTVFGLACTHCNQKKMHTLCNHTWRADKVREVMGGIEEIRRIMFPDAPIVPNMIPHLMEQVSTARNLYSSLRNDLTDTLCVFFTSVRNYVAVSGEEVFWQEFKSSLPHATAHGQINTLIHAFNHYNDPKTAHLPLKPYEFSDDERDDAGPSKSPRKVTLKVKESAEEKEDGEMDEDAEGKVDATVKREPKSSKSSPRKKRKRSPNE